LTFLLLMLVWVAYAASTLWAALSQPELPEFGPTTTSAEPVWTRRALRAAVVVHAGALVHAAFTSGAAPGLAETLGALSLGVMAAVAWFTPDARSGLARYLPPVGATLALLALALPGSWQVGLIRYGDASAILPLHVGMMLAGTTALLAEFGIAVASASLRRRLKQKRLAGLGRLPPLETLDHTQARASVGGLLLLGAGIAAGGLAASVAMHHQTWLLDPKVLFSILVWGWYAGAHFWRSRRGWSSRGALSLSIAGFVLLVFLAVGFDFVVASFHGVAGQGADGA
jgi:ABC-type uncharacterized transport system permease subunit